MDTGSRIYMAESSNNTGGKWGGEPVSSWKKDKSEESLERMERKMKGDRGDEATSIANE